MVSLTDDASLRTSDHFGSWLDALWNLWCDWIGIVETLQADPPWSGNGPSPLASIARDCTDYWQGAIHNALVGYYRLAHASLRSALENMVIGLCLELSPDAAAFEQWACGETEIMFGSAVDHVAQHGTIKSLERVVKAATGDNLFRPERRKDGSLLNAGGFVRRLIKELHRYTHAAPGHTDGEIWCSNGPIFVPEAFAAWTYTFLATYAVALLAVELVRPGLAFHDENGASSTVPRLLAYVIDQLPEHHDARRLFEAVLLSHKSSD